MLYRTYFPDDIDITVPYVAPLCRSVEDGRHEPFLRTVAMPDDRQKVEDFQMEVLKRKAALLPHFKKYCSVRKLQFRAPVEDIYDYTVLEYSFHFGSGVFRSAGFRQFLLQTRSCSIIWLLSVHRPIL